MVFDFNKQMYKKLSKDEIDHARKVYKALPSDLIEIGCKFVKPSCDKFMESDEYKNGDTTYGGYVGCCDNCGFCGGMSGWVIFLIIVLVLSLLAGGAAAFWFFYWNRKRGGEEEQVEEGKEDTESTNTENPKSVIEIPVGTY